MTATVIIVTIALYIVYFLSQALYDKYLDTKKKKDQEDEMAVEVGEIEKPKDAAAVIKKKAKTQNNDGDGNYKVDCAGERLAESWTNVFEDTLSKGDEKGLEEIRQDLGINIR